MGRGCRVGRGSGRRSVVHCSCHKSWPLMPSRSVAKCAAALCRPPHTPYTHTVHTCHDHRCHIHWLPLTTPPNPTPRLQGYHGDTSRMFYVGEVSPAARQLCETTKEALNAGGQGVNKQEGLPASGPSPVLPARA